VTPRQTGPHAHGAYFSPDSRFLFVSDLGLDKIMSYRITAAGALEPLDPPLAPLKPGSGPRHMAFAPNGRFTYAANELNSTGTAFSYDKGTGGFRKSRRCPRFRDTTAPTASITLRRSKWIRRGSSYKSTGTTWRLLAHVDYLRKRQSAPDQTRGTSRNRALD
jgi:hypothetical protein